ncbi:MULTISPECIES: hypothetical protein [Vibrio]|uniref:hypothetical protein n=1 Tax=Vibrio TaxID=662 RepID=UPI00215D1773|nr:MULTISPECIES: hypothetical protein [Vibrio]MCR9309166.1 hypothetical protein [Vibrio diabolicus]MDU9596114.1 hypothetical protein [Vibrio sp. 2-1-2a]MDU9605331.1 hypothetical protein [Vibrio sp. 1-2-3a]
MKVYSSFPNKMNFVRSGIDIDSIYKRYALLYDQVIFNRHGCPIGGRDEFSDVASYIGCTVAHRGDRNTGLKLARNTAFKSLFVDMWDFFDNPEELPYQASSYIAPDIAQQVLGYSWFQNALDQEMGIHNHTRESKAAAIVGSDISSDIAFNLLLSDKIPDFNMSLAPVIGRAFASSHNIDNEMNLFTTELIIPDFESLSWDQILELRQDKYIQSFRNKVFNNVGTGVHPDESLHESLEKDLWYLAEQAKPNIEGRLLEMFLSNLPLPSTVNPFSYFYGAKSLAQGAANVEKSWVYVIQHMKKLS